MNYRPLIFDEKAILDLYKRNNWTMYLKQKDTFLKGIKSSLDVIGAYDKQTLVGLIRVVGDGHTILYIQDILVLPEYQNKGIGTKLIQTIIEKYHHVRQIVLTTDDSEQQLQFYQKNGFKKYQELNLNGFYYKK